MKEIETELNHSTNEDHEGDSHESEQEIFERTVQLLGDKHKTKFKEDYLTFVVLCQLKSNAIKYAINDRKRA